MLSHIYAVCPDSLKHAATSLILNDDVFNCLIDSCSSESYINEEIAKKLGLKVHKFSKHIRMAQNTLSTRSEGYVVVDFILNLNKQKYSSVRLGTLKNLCSDVVLRPYFTKKVPRNFRLLCETDP